MMAGTDSDVMKSVFVPWESYLLPVLFFCPVLFVCLFLFVFCFCFVPYACVPQSGSADFGVTGNTALVVYKRVVVVVVEMVELRSCVKGGGPGLPVPNKPYGFCGSFCGRKATWEKKKRGW